MAAPYFLHPLAVSMYQYIDTAMQNKKQLRYGIGAVLYFFEICNLPGFIAAVKKHSRCDQKPIPVCDTAVA